MIDLDAWVPLAEIARPHGVRGEVRLKVFNERSDVLLEQDEVLVRLKGGEEHEVSVEGARRVSGAILFKLFSVDDRDRAETLRGALVCVRRRVLPAPAEGEFYAVDIIGAEALLAGERVGQVADMVSYPAADVLVIRSDDGEGSWEVPLTEAYVQRVDVEARKVELSTLEGLEMVPKKGDRATKAARRASTGRGRDEAIEGARPRAPDEE